MACISMFYPPILRLLKIRSSEEDYEKHSNLRHKVIGFAGDSVTFGYDDDRKGKQLKISWPQRVAQLLGTTVINCGVSSATVLPLDSWCPISWSNEYHKIPDKIDILGFMIGINDCFRNYALGSLGDRTNETFYGGLFTLIRGLKDRYKSEDGKDIFLLIYPHYDMLERFKLYIKAMYETAEYFSIPVCDLSLVLGVSPYNDDRYLYWRKYSTCEYHSPHPTQITSDLIAKVVANYIYAHYNIG